MNSMKGGEMRQIEEQNKGPKNHFIISTWNIFFNYYYYCLVCVFES